MKNVVELTCQVFTAQFCAPLRLKLGGHIVIPRTRGQSSAPNGESLVPPCATDEHAEQ
jgi:hypothetical protein